MSKPYVPYKVFCQNPPRLVRHPTQFREGEYVADVRYVGEVQARAGTEAIDLAKVKFPLVAAPIVERVGGTPAYLFYER